MGVQIFQISRGHLNCRRQKGDIVHLHIDDLQILSDTVENLAVTVIWRPGFVHP
jgi:hypothetical protein